MPPFTSFSSMLSLPRRRLLTSLNPRYKPQPWALTPKHPRYLSTTPVLQKKEKKSKPAAELESKSSKNAATSEDPSDLTAVQDGIARAVSRLKDDLSKLRSGGRFNTEAIETLRVQVSKESKETARLGELAQVVPRGGRMITVLVSEQDVSHGVYYCVAQLLMPKVIAHQTHHICHRRLGFVPNAAAGPAQSPAAQCPHPSAHQGVSGSERADGAPGVGEGCRCDSRFAGVDAQAPADVGEKEDCAGR